MHLRTLKQKSPRELAQHAEEVGVANPGTLPKQQAILAILKHVAAQQETITAEGTLEIMRDGFGYLRTIESNYLAAPMIFMSRPNKSSATSCKQETPSKAPSSPRASTISTSRWG